MSIFPPPQPVLLYFPIETDPTEFQYVGILVVMFPQE